MVSKYIVVDVNIDVVWGSRKRNNKKPAVLADDEMVSFVAYFHREQSSPEGSFCFISESRPQHFNYE